jgi:hypothetical protein
MASSSAERRRIIGLRTIVGRVGDEALLTALHAPDDGRARNDKSAKLRTFQTPTFRRIAEGEHAEGAQYCAPRTPPTH